MIHCCRSEARGSYSKDRKDTGITLKPFLLFFTVAMLPRSTLPLVLPDNYPTVPDPSPISPILQPQGRVHYMTRLFAGQPALSRRRSMSGTTFNANTPSSTPCHKSEGTASR